MINNITNIKFVDEAVKVSLTQYDVGQVLHFEDAFPTGTEVQFDDGSVKVIVNKEIKIPDTYLTTSGGKHAWIQVIGEDSETTVYRISIVVKSREKKNDYVEPEDEDTFREDIQALVNQNTAAYQAAVTAANAAKTAAAASAEAAATSAENAEASADEAADSASNASSSEDAASASATAAAASATAASTAKTQAESYASQVSTDKAAVTATAAQVAANKQTAETAASSAHADATAAGNSASSAASSARAAQGYAASAASAYDSVHNYGENTKTDIGVAKSGALSAISTARQSALSDIDTKSEAAEAAIVAEGTAQKNAVTAKATEAIEQIESSEIAGRVSDLEDSVETINEDITKLGLSIDENGNIIDSWYEEEL